MKKSSSKSAVSIILKIITCAVILFLMFWFQLPPINIRSRSFWAFICQAVVVVVAVHSFSYIYSFIKKFKNPDGEVMVEGVKKFKLKNLSKPLLCTLGFLAVVFLLSITMDIIGARIFNANRYHTLITTEERDFIEDVDEIRMNQVPIVDRATATILGNRQLGEISDLVSQFRVADNYNQINFREEPYRVTPLVYGDIIRWFNNVRQGIPAYIKVNMTTQEATAVRLEQGMRYSESEFLLRNLRRHLRFNHPTRIFDDISFEIDDDGTPYWVASTVKFRIGFWSGRDIDGAVLVNAITGESTFYPLEQIPRWVDQIYDSDLIMQQLDFYGRYRRGFWNSIFGQREVLQPTYGHNYLALYDDVWLYTGMTSALADDHSNVGFVLVNLRTKEARFYNIPGADERSAMRSSEGSVQHLEYTSTFPILLNIGGRPTYFMSLKDGAGLVKMHAFVDVQAFQVVGVGTTVNLAYENYIESLEKENIPVDTPAAEDGAEAPQSYSIFARVSQINSAVVDGNTRYFIMLEGREEIFVIDISMSEHLPFIARGDEVRIEFTTDRENVTVTGFSKNNGG